MATFSKRRNGDGSISWDAMVRVVGYPAHIFTASKQPWVVLPAGVPAVPEYYDREHHWPTESLARRQVLLPQIEAYRARLRQG